MQNIKAFSQNSFSVAALNEMPHMVRVIDKDANVLYANKAFRRRFGEEYSLTCKRIPGATNDCENCNATECIELQQKTMSITNVRGRVYSVGSSPILFDNTAYALEIITDITHEYTLKDKLMSTNARMVNDLEVARGLQLSILRNELPCMDDYNFCAEFLPCDALGGDMYDCFIMRDGRIFMYIADVSGHGVMPAMLTVYLRQEMFTQCKKQGIMPAEVLENMQLSFEELNLEPWIYITIFAIVLEPQTGGFFCANAGHSVTPLIAGKDKVRELFLPGNPICRWVDSQAPKMKKGTLEKGERLFLYTDGLDDVHVDKKVSENLCEMLSDKSLSCTQLLCAIKEKFAQKKEDDVTMLLCERK